MQRHYPATVVTAELAATLIVVVQQQWMTPAEAVEAAWFQL
jgi:hypothetical protein